MAEPDERGIAGGSGRGEAILFVGGPPAVAGAVLVGVALAVATGSIWVGLAAVAGGLLQIPLSLWLLETRAKRAASTPDATRQPGRRPAATSVLVLLLLSVVAALVTGLVTAAGYGWIVAAAFIVALAGLIILSFFD